MFKRFGTEIENLGQTFAIDAVLITLLSRGKRYRVRDDLRFTSEQTLHFGRAMLKAAIEQGQQGLQVRRANARQSWKNISQLANRAERSIEALISALTATKGPSRRRDLHFTSLSMRQVSILSKYQGLHPPRAYTKMPKAMDNIYKAKGSISWIGTHADFILTLLGDRKNPGNPEKYNFAREILYGWAYLTGTIASHNNTLFADLLSAAWSDATRNNRVDDWEHHIRKAAKEVRWRRVVLKQLTPYWIEVDVPPAE